MIYKGKQKLVQVTATLDPELGGPVAVVENMNEYLDKSFNHSILVFGQSHLKKLNTIEEATIQKNRYGLIYNLNSKRFRQELISADIVLFHGFFLFSTLYGLIFSRSSDIFIMPHGSLEEYQFRVGRLRKRVFNFIFHKIIGRREFTFLLGSNQEIVSVRKQFPNAKIQVVGLGIVNLPGLSANRISENGRVELFCMSRIAEKKRLDLCLLAVALLRSSQYDFRLSIYGSGDSQLENQLRTLSTDLEIESYVQFKGFVAGDDRIQGIADSHIFLLPSENENFAVAVAESISGLRPVVVSQNVAMHSFVNAHSTGATMNHLSAEELAQKILEIVDNYDFYVQNCIDSRELLSWKLVSKNWISILEGAEK